MRAYQIESFGSVDGVVLGSRPDPQPGTREILVRVRATSLNYRDLMVLKGGGRGPTKLGVVPLSDGAGEVVALGDGASRFAVGDRVIGCFHPRWFGGPIKPDYLTDRLGANLDGMLAEYAVVNEEAAVADPERSFVRGSGNAALRRGDRLGRVDRPSPRHRRRYGADPRHRRRVDLRAAIRAAARGPGHRDDLLGGKSGAAEALGAAAVINYVETPEWHEKVVELTDGRALIALSKSADRAR